MNDYDEVSDILLSHESHKDQVDAIIAWYMRRVRERELSALLPCGHPASCAEFEGDKAICRGCVAETTRLELLALSERFEFALRAIAKHGGGLPRVVAELTLKDAAKVGT